MTGPAYHGWTHRPKSEGGTDPIPFPSSGLPVAFAFGGISGANSGILSIDFDSIAWNDDTVFGYAQTSGSSPVKARYVTVTPGIYDVRAVGGWNSALTVVTSIQLKAFFPSTSSSDLLANSIGTDAYQEENSAVWNEQLDSGERAHLSLRDNIVFSWTEAVWGESELGLGMQIQVASAQTKSWTGQMMIARLGDATTDQTIT